jgi:catechol 2,3-dioxygenase-like lactoylglutathione lyase family enzyme
MRLRQIALVTRDLEAAVEHARAVLGLEVSFRDPGVGVFGLRNAVLPVGDTFLEILTTAKEGTSAGRFLERRGGDGGYMVIVQEQQLDAARKRLAELGVRVVWEATLDDAATIHLHPRDVGAAILALDWMDPPDSWRWAGPAWREHVRTDVVRGITGVELEADDWRALARRWSGVLGRPLADAGVLPLEEGVIRFAPPRDGRGAGLGAVELAAADARAAVAAARARGLRVREEGHAAPEIELCGTWLRLA